MNATITQLPSPGKRLLRFCGDRIHFLLTVPPELHGTAFVRTNLGHAHITRQEIIRLVEHNEPRLGRDWFDIPMKAVAPGRFEFVLGLTEVGHFEAKCLFIPADRPEPLWPSGDNTVINTEPADTCCGNIIYNAFVRQFGRHKNMARTVAGPAADSIKNLDKDGYTVIPPSGTFRDLIAELDFIMLRLGCRIVQLLPIHPTPTTYARMGRYGSPYAALSFTDVDAALAVFDATATPMEQFLELVDAVHARFGKVIIDIAINHTGWAASLHETHPQWLSRNDKGEIQNPGAWGVVWADLTRLDYSHKELWTYMADVFLTWCRRGVDGFRCDAGYMIPILAWQYIIAKVREQFPDTIFLLEGLGGKISVTRDLLNRADFNWAYSELFQNYDRGQIEWYLPGAGDIAACDGLTVNFAETHDNNRMAATSTTYARMRTALCALLAPNGAFGFTNGVEWFATEKINVHEACALNWGAAENQVDAIARLSAVLKTHPAFGRAVDLALVGRGQGNFIALRRHHRPSGCTVLVLANLDCDNPVRTQWNQEAAHFEANPAVDLLTAENVPLNTAAEHTLGVLLAPGQVCCLTDPEDPWLRSPQPDAGQVPPQVTYQRLRAKALEAMACFGTQQPLPPDAAVDLLRTDPAEFCRRINTQSAASRVVDWQFPGDLRRHVMIPPNYFVLFRADHPFRIRITDNGHIRAIEQSITDKNGRPFVLLAPLTTPSEHKELKVEITRHTPAGSDHDHGRLLYLAIGRTVNVRTSFARNDCHRIPLLMLDTNGRGAMMRVHADWQHLESRYDALLAANLNPDFPEDRHIMLTRCRAWILFQGYSQPINLDCLARFGFDFKNGAWWRYRIPSGQGEHIVLQITLSMDRNAANTVRLTARRLKRIEAQQELDDRKAVTLIIRPDIEDRNFHHCTKAYTGPEHHWPGSISVQDSGFSFAPSADHCLSMQADNGRFISEPEWYYMVHRPMEAGRGLDPDSDLFGPGYFTCQLTGGQHTTLTAQVITGDTPSDHTSRKSAFEIWTPDESGAPLVQAMEAALEHYVVRRGDFRTVIAGYPWFLDWGRDTLIAARGLVAAGRFETVKAILLQFARFEADGTLPNMIRGNDATNRDTSDAPLWFFTACADLVAAECDADFLKSDCNGRSLLQVLADMATAIMNGTPNGITMDPASGLIFSPSHFTWMDTNFPAGTPRQGYPIEIEALWFAALDFLARVHTEKKRWRTLSAQVRASIETLFWDPEAGYLVDCRHARTGQSAAQAVPDDALRPNQLLALTLGAVSDQTICRRVLEACGQLLVPGAIRSLADRPVRMPLEIRREGQLLNDPQHPYWGTYTGDEDTRRKPAYHNGTAWTWPFPSFCEAWAACYGPSERATALAWLSSSILLINGHCVGQVPEIVDGDAPHHQRGCDAQAWGVSELLRVWKKLIA
jgi:starch synthase (maltosyl-transferring)